jgi:3-dehydroquinate dehydratase
MSSYKSFAKPKTLTIAHEPTVDECVGVFRNAVYEGTDALGVMMNTLNPEERTEEKLRALMNYAGDVPVLAMNYRQQKAPFPLLDDQTLVDSLFTAVRAGADMVDLMGDLYDECDGELTYDAAAIAKQKDLIAQFREMGTKVLVSSHMYTFKDSEQTIEHFKQLESRGADIVKIAMSVHSQEEADEAFRTSILLKDKLSQPYVFVCMGQYGKLHRMVGPMLGAEYALCVQSYTANAHREQVLLRAARTVYANTDFTMARDTSTSTLPPVDGRF